MVLVTHDCALTFHGVVDIVAPIRCESIVLKSSVGVLMRGCNCLILFVR